MRTYTYRYGERPLHEEIGNAFVRESENVLVQILCGEGGKRLHSIAQELTVLLPQAYIIGATTDGEIEQEAITTYETIIVLSVFEQTQLKSASVSGTDSYRNGRWLAKTLVTSHTRLLLLFSDGTTCNGERFLKGIESIHPNVSIVGGMAGDNGKFRQTYVLEGKRLLKQGAVGVALNSQNLYIHHDFSFSWSPIGIEHTIDVVTDNRVYRIDGMSAVDFYAHYLGEEVAGALPATGIEFPLLLERNGFLIARAVIARHSDDSLSFAGNLCQGDRVRLGFGNAEMIMRESLNAFVTRYHYNVESFFVYSCMARRRYMPELIQMEIKPYAMAAATAGFFTYGEFFHYAGKNYLLNQTMTVVALSESIYPKQMPPHIPAHGISNAHNDYVNTIKALTHLIEQSTRDYEAQTKRLEEEKRYSQQLLASQRLFMRYTVHELNTPLSIIMSNIELFELQFGRHPYLSNIEVALKNLYGIYDDLGYLVKKDQVKYPRQKIEMCDYIRSRIDFFHIVARQLRLEFDFQCAKQPCYVLINETKLQRIVDNNLTNALKYTREGEPIHILVQKRRNGVYFAVSSRSIRIEDPKQVFNAYYREQYTKEGLGLGLSLVRQICKEEGIEITLDSTESRTTFGYFFGRD